MPARTELTGWRRVLVDIGTLWGHTPQLEAPFVWLNILNLGKPLFLFMSFLEGKGFRFAGTAAIIASGILQEFSKSGIGNTLCHGYTKAELLEMEKKAEQKPASTPVEDAERGWLLGVWSAHAPRVQGAATIGHRIEKAKSPQMLAEFGVWPLFICDALARWVSFPKKVRQYFTLGEVAIIDVQRSISSGPFAEALMHA